MEFSVETLDGPLEATEKASVARAHASTTNALVSDVLLAPSGVTFVLYNKCVLELVERADGSRVPLLSFTDPFEAACRVRCAESRIEYTTPAGEHAHTTVLVHADVPLVLAHLFDDIGWTLFVDAARDADEGAPRVIGVRGSRSPNASEPIDACIARFRDTCTNFGDVDAIRRELARTPPAAAAPTATATRLGVKPPPAVVDDDDE